MTGKVKVTFSVAALVFAFSSSAFADLTGKWTESNGSKYYIRQVGATIYWYGEDMPQWSHVAYGSYSANKILTLNLSCDL